MSEQEAIRELMTKARAAQRELSTYSQKQIDVIVRAIGKAVFDHAEELAELAFEETGMGNVKDKTAKNQGKARMIWYDLKTKKSIGILAEYPEQGLIEVAKPIGVIASVTPSTNPVVTPMCNAMMAIKCANAVIIAPHPKAKKLTVRLKELWDAELDKLNGPKDAVQVIAEPSLALTDALMRAADAVVATGGTSMVKAAYSSGKPSYGVGQGNVQCIFDRDIDIPTAVEETLAGRIFDNGIICAGEQTVIAPEENYDEIIAEFGKCGAFYLDDEGAIDRLRDVLFPGGKLYAPLVGRSVSKIMEEAGIVVPEGTTAVIIPRETAGGSELLSKEKMFPIMTAYRYASWDDALAIAESNLAVEGKGHSLSLRSNDREHILAAAKRIDVSRVVVNQICSTSAGGSFKNGLNPTTTIGCGSWGNNSISENFTYYHMMNRIRVAMVKPGWRQPTDEEIWGE